MECKCSNCGNESSITCKLSSWNDLEIEVEPCETCLKEAEEKGEENAN